MRTYISSKLLAALVLGLLASVSASANLITTDVFIERTAQGSVYALGFDVTTAGHFRIEGDGSSELGVGYDYNPEIQLFADSLSLANWLGGDDNEGPGMDALLKPYLDVGHYILVVSEHTLTPAEAVALNNVSSIDYPNTWIQAKISSINGVAHFSVPEPGTVALLGLMLAAVPLTRSRQR